MPQNNAPPGTPIANAGEVSPGGIQGPAGPSSTVTFNGISPTTAKGDLIGDNGAGGGGASNVRVPVGTDKYVLHADSTQAAGMRWGVVDLTGVASALSGALPVASGGSGQITRTLAFNALAPATPTLGDLLKFDGTNWVKLPIGTALQNLRVNAGATDIEWGAGSAVILQALEITSNAFVNGGVGAIPYDDTIPQIGEGDALISLGITPTTTTSRVEVECLVPIDSSGLCQGILAVFTGGAGALSAIAQTLPGGSLRQLQLVHVFVPGSTSPITVSVRVGVTGGASYFINGDSGGARKFGGVQRVILRLREYA